MLGVPARIAGCKTRVLCSPAQASGRVDAAVLYAARVAGVHRVFKLGGAQAIAAMAYGTKSVPKVDKIFGPGNTWVTEAKAQVDRDPAGAARDYPAGPSEVLVIADESANAEFVAADLLSQAEHGADSQVLLVTTSKKLGRAVMAAVATQKTRLTRGKLVEGALEHSSVIVVDDLKTAFAISNRYAPEHLILQIDRAARLARQGDGGRARCFSARGPRNPSATIAAARTTCCRRTVSRGATRASASRDFVRSMTVQELTLEGLRAIGPVATTLAAPRGPRRPRLGRRRAAWRPHARRICDEQRARPRAARSCAASGLMCPGRTSRAAFG